MSNAWKIFVVKSQGDLSVGGMMMTQSKLAEAAAFLTCVRDVPISGFSWDTDYPDSFFLLRPSGGYRDSILKQTTTHSFHILSSSSFINHATVRTGG
jgi:hypothetical protein